MEVSEVLSKVIDIFFENKLYLDIFIISIPWRRKQLPTPVFLPGESYGQRSLMSYRSWRCKQLDVTERLTHNNREDVHLILNINLLINLQTLAVLSPMTNHGFLLLIFRL